MAWPVIDQAIFFEHVIFFKGFYIVFCCLLNLVAQTFHRAQDRRLRVGRVALETLVAIAPVVVDSSLAPVPEEGIGKAINNFKTGLNEKPEIDVTPEKDQVNDGGGETKP